MSPFHRDELRESSIKFVLIKASETLPSLSSVFQFFRFQRFSFCLGLDPLSVARAFVERFHNDDSGGSLGGFHQGLIFVSGNGVQELMHGGP